MTRALQKFSKESLERSQKMTPDEVISFLEGFRAIVGAAETGRSRLISMKVPENLLKAFRDKARLEGRPYQTQIKKLMVDWLKT